MRRPLVVLTIAVVLIAGAHLRADDLTISFFGDYLESLRRQAGIPGLSAVIVGPTEVSWARGLGVQSVERNIATQTNTPFHTDGLMQTITASLVLRCVEEGRLSLDARVGQFDAQSPDAAATISQILTHTTGSADSAVFNYRPERVNPLALAVQSCTGESFRATVAKLLDRVAMIDSVPGADVMQLAPPDPGIPTGDIARYGSALAGLAVPYIVDSGGRAAPTQYSRAQGTLQASGGLISTVDDLARFDLAIKRGVLLQPDTLAAAWRPPVGRDGQPLPHGLGWFVQSYNGNRIVWQYGVGENGSSSLIVTIMPRGITLILLANSDGLVRPYALSAGDLTVSPIGRVFLGLFAR
jgi:CubicO group peptidase (beta-lactamase class C family)